MGNGCLCVSGVVVKDIRSPPICHESFVDWKIEILDLSKSPEDLSDVTFCDIFGQFFYHDLRTSWRARVGSK